ncbi:transmembrane protein 275-like [Megalops cyprinoides]|uniref:transmembrane protein 275-like n=1 Tax=Megalops cyprinoides TaxID=118141 RepID=UPI0018644B5C|nr:transmembrane protein 275-like [Megalops cyprinoides]
MMFTDKSSSTSVPKKASKKKKKTRPQGLPSPALCCACGLCIMLAGINITLVGAFAFGTFMPRNNPPIIIGPMLLLVAFAFFGACCVCSRRPPAQGSRKPKGGNSLGLIRAGGTAFEIETSEHTLQDTTAVQLSPTNSPCSSSKSSPSHEASTTLRTCKLFTMEANGPASACYSTSSGGEAIQLSLPRDSAAT